MLLSELPGTIFKVMQFPQRTVGRCAANRFDALPAVASFSGMIYVVGASGSGIMRCDAVGRIAAALHAGEEETELYGGRRFRVSNMGIHQRRVKRESLVL